MNDLKRALAIIGLTAVCVTLGSALISIWLELSQADLFLQLADTILSWEVVAGGFVFGGAQTMIRAYKQ